jgi:uncharacterized membrane protein YhfC
MLSFGFILAILIEILLPFALGIWLARKFKTSWKLFGVGVLTFIGSQIVHFPMLSGIDLIVKGLGPNVSPAILNLSNAVLLGLAAGICEETARWVGFKLLKSRAGKVSSALMVGAGHGGVESILVGLSVMVGFVLMTAVNSGAISQLNLPSETVSALKAQMPGYMSMAWYTPLAGALERIFAVTLHITLSVMVWQALVKRSWKWFLGAVLWHAVVDAGAVMMLVYKFNLWTLEAVVGVTAVLNAIFLVRFVSRQTRVEAEAAVGELDAQSVQSV